VEDNEMNPDMFFLDDRTSEIFNDSFQRCLSKSGFFPRFYELFLNSSSEVKDKFKDTDFKKQARVVKKSLYLLTMVSTGAVEARAEIERLGQTHGREGLKVDPYMYDQWLTCLLQAVREYDIGWTPEVEKSWRKTFLSHIEALKSYS